MSRSPKSVRRLLKDKPTLKILELEISAQKALLGRVRRLLPAELAAHCVAARQHGGRLILHADSAAWATRLRFMAPQLQRLLEADSPGLGGITVRLLLQQPPRAARHRSVHRSDVAAAIIHDSARYTKYPQLREALLRLSRTLKQQS